MANVARYALWLAPTGEAFERWQALIATLSARLGTPPFEPHVTLIAAGEAERLREQTRLLALEIEPLVLNLGEVGQLDEYYRCLFVQAEISPALAHARASAARRLGLTPGTYFPHLSLVYGDLSAQLKREVIAEIGTRFDERLALEQLLLIHAPDGPATWRCLERVALGGDQSTI